MDVKKRRFSLSPAGYGRVLSWEGLADRARNLSSPNGPAITCACQYRSRLIESSLSDTKKRLISAPAPGVRCMARLGPHRHVLLCLDQSGDFGLHQRLALTSEFRVDDSPTIRTRYFVN